MNHTYINLNIAIIKDPNEVNLKLIHMGTELKDESKLRGNQAY